MVMFHAMPQPWQRRVCRCAALCENRLPRYAFATFLRAEYAPQRFEFCRRRLAVLPPHRPSTHVSPISAAPAAPRQHSRQHGRRHAVPVQRRHATVPAARRAAFDTLMIFAARGAYFLARVYAPRGRGARRCRRYISPRRHIAEIFR